MTWKQQRTDGTHDNKVVMPSTKRTLSDPNTKRLPDSQLSDRRADRPSVFMASEKWSVFQRRKERFYIVEQQVKVVNDPSEDGKAEAPAVFVAQERIAINYSEDMENQLQKDLQDVKEVPLYRERDPNAVVLARASESLSKDRSGSAEFRLVLRTSNPISADEMKDMLDTLHQTHSPVAVFYLPVQTFLGTLEADWNRLLDTSSIEAPAFQRRGEHMGCWYAPGNARAFSNTLGVGYSSSALPSPALSPSPSVSVAAAGDDSVSPSVSLTTSSPSTTTTAASNRQRSRSRSASASASARRSDKKSASLELEGKYMMLKHGMYVVKGTDDRNVPRETYARYTSAPGKRLRNKNVVNTGSVIYVTPATNASKAVLAKVIRPYTDRLYRNSTMMIASIRFPADKSPFAKEVTGKEVMKLVTTHAKWSSPVTIVLVPSETFAKLSLKTLLDVDVLHPDKRSQLPGVDILYQPDDHAFQPLIPDGTYVHPTNGIVSYPKS